MSVLTKKQGFTLIELMVAISLFVVLGMMVVGVLRDSLKTWHHTESQSSLHARAREIFRILRQDLANLYTSFPSKEIQFLLDVDADKQPRLRFVRRLPDESRDPILRNTGLKSIQEGYKDYYYAGFLKEQKYRALGGLGEVVYILLAQDEQMELWRGLKAPIGGKNSFFLDSSLSLSQIKKSCHKLASGILFLQIKCWSYNTKTWDEHILPQLGGPSLLWDSTRKKLSKFFLHISNHNTEHNSSIFPLKLQMILMLCGKNTPSGELRVEVEEDSTSIPLRSPRYFYPPRANNPQFAKIDNEWISYTDYRSETLEGVQRGIFGTEPQAHGVGAKVYVGYKFIATFILNSL